VVPIIAEQNSAAAQAFADAIRQFQPEELRKLYDGGNGRRPFGLNNTAAFRDDGVHLSRAGQLSTAWQVTCLLEGHRIQPLVDEIVHRRETSKQPPSELTALLQPEESLRQSIIAKNKLWFDYWRPQNWAFLAGDRINQPSSRDWRDPSIRWFPPEREEFLPLIKAKEKEIDALAQKLAQP
jgi:hypothetical protein